MSSNRQKREQLQAKKARKAQRLHVARILRGEIRGANDPSPLPGNLPCDPSQLAPFNGFGPPKFILDGYGDFPFRCIDCGVEEVWTSAQQKWWYEVMQGDVNAIANRCRACRQKRRAIRADANERRLAGIERKQNSPKLARSSRGIKLRP